MNRGRAGEPRVPNFFIIGAAKSGTTALRHYMGQDPRVYFSEPKEPWFFQLEYERGLDWYWSTYFSGWDGEPVVGESANKLLPGYVAARVHESAPGARLIALLRAPVERAYSHWWMYVSRGIETLSFEDAVRDNLRRLERGESMDGVDAEAKLREYVEGVRRGRIPFRIYLDYGYYADHLARYMALFPREQLRVVDFDLLRADPARVTREALGFAGLQPGERDADFSPQNTARETRQMRVFHDVLALAQRTGASRLVPRAAKNGLRRLLARKSEIPQLDPRISAWLADHYRPHDLRLSELLGDACPAWARKAG